MSGPHIDEKDVKSLLNFIDSGLAIVSREGYFVWCNSAFLEIVEYSIAEITKKKFQDITHPEDIDIDKELVAMLDSGAEDSYEMRKRYITKGGKIINVILKAVNKYDNGMHTGYYAQITNLDALSSRHEDINIEKQTFGDFMSEHWQYFLSATIFVMGIIITSGITMYTMSNKVDSIASKSADNQALILKIIEKTIEKGLETKIDEKLEDIKRDEESKNE